MRQLLAIAFLLLGAAPPAVAQSPADPAACAAIASDADRLACYDGVFRPDSGIAPDALVIASKHPIPARPTGRAPATMTIACGPDGLGVAFAFAGQLLSETGDDAAITFQVQQTGNVVRNLPVSPDNQSIMFPTPAAAEAFLESIEGGNSVIVRLTPVRQRSVQVEFELRTRETEIAAIRDACR